MRFSQFEDTEWWEVVDLPNWEDQQLLIRVGLVKGLPRTIGIQIEPRSGAEPVGLTSGRIRALPLNDFAIACYNMTHTSLAIGSMPEARKSLSDANKHDPRAAVSVGQVAAIWNLAYDKLGTPPRSEVVRRLNIRPRTADRYIKAARERGLITVPAKPGRTAKKATNAEVSVAKKQDGEEND